MNSAWSLIPPILAIVMVLLTKRVLLSLGVGIIASAFFIKSFHVVASLGMIWEAFKGVFVEDGGVNTWNVYLLLFVLLLGILTALVSMMGGTKAFGDWMIKRVKTRAGAQMMTAVLGIIIFIDDYFNSLTVGQVAKPVTDKHRVSRAKLAYIVDSTSAPVCVVAPVSSWGAYIIGILGTVLAAQSVTDHTALGAFLQVIPMNYYVWSALGMVFIIALSRMEFGPMKVHETRAIRTGEVLDPDKKERVDTTSHLPVSSMGKVRDLIIPIATLFIATVIFMYVNGRGAVEGEETFINIFGAADASESLLYGGLIGIAVTLILFFRHIAKGKLTAEHIGIGIYEGAKSMIPGFMILIFAWAIVFLIDELGTGEYLAGVVNNAHISPAFLPVIMFVIAGFIAFATGTSWGAFGILLPIAGHIAAATDIELILPMFAAVLAGSVFGDHCSPISDTTILSSTGSSCHHIDHVTTQIPYALLSAGIAGIGYIVLGITGNTWIGLLAVFVCLGLFLALTRSTKNSRDAGETVAQ